MALTSPLIQFRAVSELQGLRQQVATHRFGSDKSYIVSAINTPTAFSLVVMESLGFYAYANGTVRINLARLMAV